MHKTFVQFLCLLTIVMSLASMVSKSFACSTVMLRREGLLLTGHNLDESTDFEGFVCVNKRDYYKVGSTWGALKTYSKYLPYSFNWISKYGSITWSGQGRDLPDAGINEAGLIIEEMSLANHPYAIVSWKRRTDTSSNAVGPKHLCSGITVLKYAAILLNSIQVVVGILFVAMKGLPQESIEWVLLVMWFIVPMVNFVAVVSLNRSRLLSRVTGT